MSSRLNLVHLATLREFARRGTLAEAAEHLGYTAGAVSQHIAALNATLGTPVVERVGRIVVLTDAGRELAEQADRILTLEAAARESARAAAEVAAGPIRVGTWGSTGSSLLAPIAARLAAENPGIEIASREVDLDGAATAVQHADVDVAFGLDYEDAPMRRDPRLCFTELAREPFWVAVQPTPGTARVRTTTVAELNALPWILPPLDNHFGRAVRYGLRRRGVEPDVRHELTETSASLQLAAAGFGATLATDLMKRVNVSIDVARLNLPLPLTREVVLISHGEVPQRESVRRFVEVARAVVEELLRTDPSEAPGSRSRNPR
ncbi:MAG TPA: LysR family transcriptional regulator [Nocardioides bacterium]|uniref:LysR family transcriptional regulator n=1 Tax=uncultured Nocardioides sp. TaxID=198441 RepID=UPI000EC51FA5|nr:LysR family transcriptional regulator [uncultured Nocardioides sp.]HCB02703.1 LysR family transcriptional regulator [Nocardioides sp.]